MEKLPARAALPTLATTSSLEQRSMSARSILARPITPTGAATSAKDLVGNFANLRADNPAQFIKSVAAVLAHYPAGVVADCLDPWSGLAHEVEFLSLRSLAEWCEQRLDFYRTVASYKPPAPSLPPPEPGPISDEKIAAALAEIRARKSPSPLDILLDQRASMRRESVQRVLLYAERIAPKSEAAE